jgi:caspase domain-containing protein
VGVNVRRMLVAIAFGAVVAVSVTAALASGRVALVIGNGAYAELGTLGNPTNDADDIAATLRGMGFQVVAKDNVDERAFTGLLSDFSTAAANADVALFYYSGHGLQYRSENYLVPVDATLENRFSLTHETIPLEDVQAALSGARTALIYIDACRSFPIQGTFLASANERVTPVKGLAAVDHIDNTFVGFSASAGQTARDGNGRNSPFTTAMLEMLPKPGLDVGAMFNAVTAQVVSSTGGAQKPQSFSGLTSDVTLVAAAAAQTDSAGPDLEERAYRDASAIGTVGAYRAFVARFPGGFYSELAREALNKLQGANSTAEVEAPSIEPQSNEPAPVPKLPKGLKEPDLSYYGKVSETIGDWSISKSDAGCFMVTEAAGVSPAGWLSYRPWFYYSTTLGEDHISSSMYTGGKDGASESFTTGTVTVHVGRSDGTSHPISGVFEGTELRMVTACDTEPKGSYCVDGNGIVELMAGDTLTVSGTTATGGDGEVTYRIRGFADAAKRINEMCGAKAGYLYNDYSDQTAGTSSSASEVKE